MTVERTTVLVAAMFTVTTDAAVAFLVLGELVAAAICVAMAIAGVVTAMVTNRVTR